MDTTTGNILHGDVDATLFGGPASVDGVRGKAMSFNMFNDVDQYAVFDRHWYVRCYIFWWNTDSFLSQMPFTITTGVSHRIVWTSSDHFYNIIGHANYPFTKSILILIEVEIKCFLKCD